jgi:hypothetical protein
LERRLEERNTEIPNEYRLFDLSLTNFSELHSWGNDSFQQDYQRADRNRGEEKRRREERRGEERRDLKRIEEKRYKEKRREGNDMGKTAHSLAFRVEGGEGGLYSLNTYIPT